MKYYKQYALRSFFVLEIGVFAGIYFFGAQGLHHVWRMQHDNSKAQQTLLALQQEVHALEHQVYVWQHHPFYKEKLAREQLQMARSGEHIYLVGEA